jgi:hypothetical protein
MKANKMRSTVFIVLMSGGWTDKIVAWFFRQGFTVEPTNEKGYLLSRTDSPAATLSLNIYKQSIELEPDNKTIIKLREELMAFLNENKINYYSIIVIEGHRPVAWAGSNITLTKTKPIKKKEVSYLKLVKETIEPEPPKVS